MPSKKFTQLNNLIFIRFITRTKTVCNTNKKIIFYTEI